MNWLLCGSYWPWSFLYRLRSLGLLHPWRLGGAWLGGAGPVGAWTWVHGTGDGVLGGGVGDSTMSALDMCGGGGAGAAWITLGAMNLDRSMGLVIRGSGSGAGMEALGGSDVGLMQRHTV